MKLAHFAFWLGGFALPAQTLPLMPWPASVNESPGACEINANFSLALSGAGASDARIRIAAARTLVRLARQTGIPIAARAPVTFPNATLRVIVERRDHKEPQRLGDDESYSLQSTGDHVTISANGPLGALRGLETFLQLVQQNRGGAPGFSVPHVDIRDEPRFPWRGLSLDVSRHFIPVEGVERTIDGLAAVKLNVLHWHLSDDQGFRVESRKYPRLQKYGSDGLFYTQSEVRAVIAYAWERGVRVIPEFDIPGHSTSWLAGYPALSSSEMPLGVVHEFGDPTGVIDPTKESTYRFLDGFLGEMAKLFSDEYFHIGGDEVSAKAWTSEPRIRDYMTAHHIASAAALQAYFNKRVEKILAHHHKRMEGWDEVFQPDIPKNILIQSWRGEKSLAAAARAGYPGILSAGYYLDLMQPASQHYAVDPLRGEAADLTPEQKKLILGGEAAMWEELATAENLDAKLWPRLAAIAERFWSPESATDVNSMYVRLDRVNQWLEWIGLTQRSNPDLMLRRLGGDSAGSLRRFASALEPVKGYERHRNHYGASSPFNRLVDAIPPESDAAREFRNAVDRYLAAPLPADADRLRKQLDAWSKSVADVRPVLESESLLTEDLAVADALATQCKLGDEALMYATSAAPTGWKSRAAAALKDANAHHASLLIAITPAVEKLIDAVP
ncbi:MAG TPA: beta-N-acetylhexosaminidase [Bryobacteraceae bacterium]|jgi:hexosaminidase|nr:beta-N-acetylhexosaminidase [Bryobacteraceae bacterium]